LSDANGNADIPVPAIREDLERILRSPPFLQSERLSRLIRYTVEATLSEKADTLKELRSARMCTIAPFHPSQVPSFGRKRGVRGGNCAIITNPMARRIRWLSISVLAATLNNAVHRAEKDI
jgi:hypothetical protein